jgi:hypothetical protein
VCPCVELDAAPFALFRLGVLELVLVTYKLWDHRCMKTGICHSSSSFVRVCFIHLMFVNERGKAEL